MHDLANGIERIGFLIALILACTHNDGSAAISALVAASGHAYNH